MPWFKKRVGPPIAVKYKRRRPEFEDLCQRVDFATAEKQLAWSECRGADGKKSGSYWDWWAEADFPSGRFKVMFSRSGYYADFKIGLARSGETGALTFVELRKDFGEALYNKIRRQIYGAQWVKDDADTQAAIEEARKL